MSGDTDFIGDYAGSTAKIPTHTFGTLLVEVANLSPARDGDLVVHFGDPFGQSDRVLVRIHSECIFGEVLGSSLCDCAAQLFHALDMLHHEKRGLLFYLRFDGRGAGLAAKVKATALEMSGLDSYDSRIQIGVEPESREFSAIGRYLVNHGVTRVKLLTNNPLKRDSLIAAGIDVLTENLVVDPTNQAMRQMYATKRERFCHDIP